MGRRGEHRRAHGIARHSRRDPGDRGHRTPARRAFRAGPARRDGDQGQGPDAGVPAAEPRGVISCAGRRRA